MQGYYNTKYKKIHISFWKIMCYNKEKLQKEIALC